MHVTFTCSTVHARTMWPLAAERRNNNVILHPTLFGPPVFMYYMNISAMEFAILSVLLILKFCLLHVCYSKYVKLRKYVKPDGLTYHNTGERNGNLFCLSSVVCTHIPDISFDAISTVLYSNAHACTIHLGDTIVFSFIACFMLFRYLKCHIMFTVCSVYEHCFTAGEDL